MKLSPALLVPILLVLAACGWFVYQWFAADAAVQAEREKLLGHIAIELDKDQPDTEELARLVARIKEFEDHATAPDLAAAHARIELHRDRSERAAELFLPIASTPGARPEHCGLAARILTRRHESGLPDRGSAVVMLEQILEFAERAYGSSGSSEDLLFCWLAAMRLSDKARTIQFAERLTGDHPGSAATEFVELSNGFGPTTELDAIDRVRNQFARPQAELEAMLALAMHFQKDLPGAIAQVEKTLSAFPGVVEVRVVAAAVFAACAAGTAEQAGGNASWVRRRNAQLDWLLENAASEDPRRQGWVTARGS
ncbi:MAG: hypothetical protein NXI31_23040 [bacterium]|nr:hypothetical protein [bacterium]